MKKHLNELERTPGEAAVSGYTGQSQGRAGQDLPALVSLNKLRGGVSTETSPY